MRNVTVYSPSHDLNIGIFVANLWQLSNRLIYLEFKEVFNDVLALNVAEILLPSNLAMSAELRKNASSSWTNKTRPMKKTNHMYQLRVILA